MWAALSVALVFGVLGQATQGSAGLAIVFGVLLVALLGWAVLRRGGAHAQR